MKISSYFLLISKKSDGTLAPRNHVLQPRQRKINFCVCKRHFDDVLSWILRYILVVLHVTITMTQCSLLFQCGFEIFSISEDLDTYMSPLMVPSSSPDFVIQRRRFAHKLCILIAQCIGVSISMFQWSQTKIHRSVQCIDEFSAQD